MSSIVTEIRGLEHTRDNISKRFGERSDSPVLLNSAGNLMRSVLSLCLDVRDIESSSVVSV